MCATTIWRKSSKSRKQMDIILLLKNCASSFVCLHCHLLKSKTTNSFSMNSLPCRLASVLPISEDNAKIVCQNLAAALVEMHKVGLPHPIFQVSSLSLKSVLLHSIKFS